MEKLATKPTEEIILYGMDEYPLIEKEVKKLIKKFPKGIVWFELGKGFESAGIGIGRNHKFKHIPDSAFRVFGKNKDVLGMVLQLRNQLKRLRIVPRLDN